MRDVSWPLLGASSSLFGFKLVMTSSWACVLWLVSRWFLNTLPAFSGWSFSGAPHVMPPSVLDDRQAYVYSYSAELSFGSWTYSAGQRHILLPRISYSPFGRGRSTDSLCLCWLSNEIVFIELPPRRNIITIYLFIYLYIYLFLHPKNHEYHNKIKYIYGTYIIK